MKQIILTFILLFSCVSLAEPSVFFIQMASFSDTERAREIVGKIKADNYEAAVSFIPRKKDVLTVVFIGPFKTKDEADKHKSIMGKKLGFSDAFVIEATGP